MQRSHKTVLLLIAAGMMALVSQAQQATSPTPKPAASPKAGPSAAAKPKPKPATATPSPTPMELKTQKEKASYAIGVNIGKSMVRDSADIDPDAFARGVKDALTGGKILLSDEEANAALSALQVELQQKRQAKMQELSDKNKKDGASFLAANKAKEGVVTLPSGLQYKVLKEGTGPKPAATDSVVCNYKGTLLDGTEFDSSYKRGEPATFPVNGVIKGWTEALQLMPVGSKWQLFVPADLAYGDRGAGGEIAPGSTLVFEVELMSIKPKEPEAQKEQPKDQPGTPAEQEKK